MKIKVTHKKCFARQTVRVFNKVGKLIEKHGVREFVLFCWVEGGRYRIGWFVACCMLAERFQSRGAEHERTKWLGNAA